MKNAILLVISITIFSSCKQQIENFYFDRTKISESSYYYYEFKSDKLQSVIEKTNVHFLGRIVDTIIIKEIYEYNSKGLLRRIDTYYNQKPESEIFEYLPNDSLLYKKAISFDGDTTLWEKYADFPDGRKIIYHKEISLHISPEMDPKDIFKHKTYDTTIYRNEFIYIGNICNSMKVYNRANKIIKVVDFQYQNSRIIKETHYSIVNNIKVIEKTKQYDYSKSESKPDYYSLDSQNDTIEVNNHFFKNKNLVLQIEIDDYGERAFKRFYENGKEIGEIATGKHMPYRIIDSYDYYPNGYKKERLTYREK